MTDRIARLLSRGRDRAAALRERVGREGAPLVGTLALTHRCNLRCAHCYLGGAARDGGGTGELPTAAWEALLDGMAEAGCLDLTLTGGEPLARPDFPALYRRAKTNGCFVTVFTNGTLLAEEHLELFADLPPLAVEVSLYGATAATCDAVTGVPGSFERCLRGIGALRERGVRLWVKTMVLAANAHEVPAIRALAAGLGADFRMDGAVFPRLDGDPAPLAGRLPARQLAAVEFDEERQRRLAREYARGFRAAAGEEGLLLCGAGHTGFHVDARGRLSPCMMLPAISRDLAATPFAEGWRSLHAEVAALPAPRGYPCNGCPERALCVQCPAFSLLETGDLLSPPGFLCELSARRAEAVYGEAILPSPPAEG